MEIITQQPEPSNQKKMKKNTISHILLFLIASLFIFTTCKKPPQYSEIPLIDYQKIIAIDTVDTSDLHNDIRRYKIYFNVLDGDGDIGSNDSSKTNMFVKFYSKENGIYEEVEFEIDIPFSYRIPYVAPIGLNDYYKSEILIDIDFPTTTFIPFYDTIRFDFYINDSLLHKSNLQVTHELPINFTGLLIDTVAIIKEE